MTPIWRFGGEPRPVDVLRVVSNHRNDPTIVSRNSSPASNHWTCSHPCLELILNKDLKRGWTAVRLTLTAIDAGHDVETFLLGEDVEGPDFRHDKVNPAA